MPNRNLFVVLLLALTASSWASDIHCPSGSVANHRENPGGNESWCALAEAPSILHGPYRAWFGSGVLAAEEHYIQGKANGPAAYRWASGNRQAAGLYRNSLRDGWWNFWDKTGAPAGRVKFHEGRIAAGKLPKWAADWDGQPAARPPAP